MHQALTGSRRSCHCIIEIVSHSDHPGTRIDGDQRRRRRSGTWLWLPAAPTAPAPLVPEVFTPAKLITVKEEPTLCDRVAVTATPLRGATAKARHISDVPLCPLARTTSDHVRPPPETPFTVVFVPPRKSVAMNASSSSLAEAVENAGDTTVALELPLSFETLTSSVIADVCDEPPKLMPDTLAAFKVTDWLGEWSHTRPYPA